MTYLKLGYSPVIVHESQPALEGCVRSNRETDLIEKHRSDSTDLFPGSAGGMDDGVESRPRRSKGTELHKRVPLDSRVSVEALCDLNEDLLKSTAAKYGISKTYRVFEDMLESDIGAVVIATPMQCHVPQALSALEAGKHVMSEVTAGVTMDELWWLIEWVEKQSLHDGRELLLHP